MSHRLPSSDEHSCAHCVGARRLRPRGVLRGVSLLPLLLGAFGCVGAFVDLHATGYPSLRTAAHPTDGAVLPEGPRPIEQVKPGVGVGFTVGIELDDGRTSRWAVGYSADSIVQPTGGTAHHHFNDLRVDVTMKTFTDDDRLRLTIGGGIGAGSTRLPLDDGGYSKKGSGSAVVYSGPVYAHYVGNHSVLSAMLGGSFLIIGAGDYVVRGWGLTTHLTYAYTFDDSHPDVVIFHPIGPNFSMESLAAAAQRIGCGAHLGENEKEQVSSAYLTCGDETVELHVADDVLHVHCERSTIARCRDVFERVEAALPPAEKAPLEPAPEQKPKENGAPGPQ